VPLPLPVSAASPPPLRLAPPSGWGQPSLVPASHLQPEQPWALAAAAWLDPGVWRGSQTRNLQMMQSPRRPCRPGIQPRYRPDRVSLRPWGQHRRPGGLAQACHQCLGQLRPPTPAHQSHVPIMPQGQQEKLVSCHSDARGPECDATHRQQRSLKVRPLGRDGHRDPAPAQLTTMSQYTQ
jgi:hypothetical protein